MSRLCVFYALQDAEICRLREMPPEERYDYLLEEIEPALLGTDAGYEMDKAWEGVQYCLGGGVWSEENRLPGNVVFGGEFLVDTDEEVMTLKSHAEVRRIVEFLQTHDLAAILRENYDRIPAQAYSLPKTAEGLEYLIDWSRGLQAFYGKAMENHCQVIFTVDL